MGLMVKIGDEIIRFNPSNNHIEFSKNGISWFKRGDSSSTGIIKSLISHNDNLLACSNKGVIYSHNNGFSWFVRSPSNKDFVDLIDNGDDILAITSDGRAYVSHNDGQCWFRRG